MIVDCMYYSARTGRRLANSDRRESWPDRALDGELVRARRADWDSELRWFDERGEAHGVATDTDGRIVRAGDPIVVVGGSSNGARGEIRAVNSATEAIVYFPATFTATAWPLSGLRRVE
jgi:hypothetical protein